jgi:hypothetical protein
MEKSGYESRGVRFAGAFAAFAAFIVLIISFGLPTRVSAQVVGN